MTESQRRLAVIKDKQETLVRTLETEVVALRNELQANNQSGEKLKTVNGTLRRNNRALRDANAKGVGDADLINSAMMAELDALRVVHDSDRSASSSNPWVEPFLSIGSRGLLKSPLTIQGS